MSVMQSGGGTFSIPNQYAASAVVVADGVMALATKYLLTSATAAFTQLMQGIPITVAGAGLAAADLVTRIEEVISATKVRLKDPALTAVAAANLTYTVGRIRLRNLLLKGDIDAHTFDLLYAQRLQLQVNSLSPGKVYVGSEYVTPTNAGIELSAPGSVDDENTGRTLGDWICADADSSLVNVFWECN